jgi:hypothetical protein
MTTSGQNWEVTAAIMLMHRISYQRLVKDMSDLYYQLLNEKITANAVLR